MSTETVEAPAPAEGYTRITDQQQRQILDQRLMELEAEHFRQSLVIEEVEALDVPDQDKTQALDEQRDIVAQLAARLGVVRAKLAS